MDPAPAGFFVSARTHLGPITLMQGVGDWA